MVLKYIWPFLWFYLFLLLIPLLSVPEAATGALIMVFGKYLCDEFLEPRGIKPATLWYHAFFLAYAMFSLLLISLGLEFLPWDKIFSFFDTITQVWRGNSE